MNFVFSKNEIEDKSFQLVYEESALAGVKRVASLVSADIEKVLGAAPEVCSSTQTDLNNLSGKVLICTAGYSQLFDELCKLEPSINDDLQGKREIYSFKVVALEDGTKPTLIIAGSDKRGTIYGLFHLSELMGVSPLVNWNQVTPLPRKAVELTEQDNIVSKEPSVKYRGFFINDEWPAFGNWCNEHFGGFTAECYAQIFELLLRLKGNYLWPAMWSAVFSEDGPGIENARLADELGVVMGMSHHEPCLRNGEEYSHVRGKDSIYGDAWNFRSNEAGITRFWEDGLKRNGQFENVITVGMRGEADSTIMGKDTTLKDNIDLLRDVLKCQNRLIKENVNENLDEVPRMLALYKEVEPFYYGDAQTEGLMTSPELDGVTLMLCDDNFGNLRTIPTEEMRKHKGGFGMYYHFDYHGWPVSYEWINSSYLPKVWEQMTYAYEAGIRELWIVNVGDVFTMEYPLSYFLDLAYDYDKWGISNMNSPEEYSHRWVETQFGVWLDTDAMKETHRLLDGYTRVMYKRRPEAMNDRMYDTKSGYPTEAFADSISCDELMCDCETLYNTLPDEVTFPFFQFVYYPLMGTVNVRQLWADTTVNHYLARIGATEAMEYAANVRASLDFDKDLMDRLHQANDRRWYGMGMSEHIGFANWNEEECRYPILHEFRPANKKRIVAVVPGTNEHTEGGDWTKRTMHINLAENSKLVLYAGSDMDVKFSIEQLSENLNISMVSDAGIEYENSSEGIVPAMSHITISITEVDEGTGNGSFMIVSEGGAHIRVEVSNEDTCCRTINTKEYSSKSDVEGAYTYVPEIGIKAFPVSKIFEEDNAPSVTYEYEVGKAGRYDIKLVMNPGNPPFMDQRLLYKFETSGGMSQVCNAVAEGFKIGDDQAGWMMGVLENKRINVISTNLEAGKNWIKISAISPNVTIREIQVVPAE